MRTLSLSVVALCIAALGAAGCAGESSPDDGEVTWHADVSPMMQEHCVRCHSSVGQGVGDFTELETVQSFSGRMLARMDEGTMPPPTADPACRDYRDSEHLNLPADKKDLFQRWVDAGMPEGDPESAPELDLPALELTDADMRLTPPEPYLPQFADERNPGNEYRCFVLEHDRDETFYVTGFAPIVDEPQLVHHVLLLTVPASDIPDDYDPAVGMDCIDGRGPLGDIEGMIAGWAPGMQPVTFDDGRGIAIEPHQKLVVQTHLFRKGPEVDGLTDQTGWALRTATEVDTPMLMAPLGHYNFRIPAGDDDYTFTDGTTLPVGVTVHAVFPHMHVLGTGYKAWADLDDGSEACLVEGTYDFDNQLSYIFKEPVGVPANTRINLSCTWDNSADNPNQLVDEPKDVGYGDRTDEEMCFAFSLVSIGLPD